MITFDCDRSKRRLGIAKKQLSIIKNIEVPSRAFKYEGFTYKVYQQDDLAGGRIMAPAGLMAVHSTTTGIKIAMFDFYGGAPTSLTDLYVTKFYPESSEKPAIRWFQYPEAEDFVDAGFEQVLFVPVNTRSYEENLQGYGGSYITIPASTEGYQDIPCRPSLWPFSSGEALWVSVTSRLDCEDPDPASGYEYTKHFSEHVFLYYMSDNSNLAARLSTVIHEDWHRYIWSSPVFKLSDYRSNYILQRVGAEKIYAFTDNYDQSAYDTNTVVAWELTTPINNFRETVLARVTLDDIFPDSTVIPEALRNILVFTNYAPVTTWGSSALCTYFFQMPDQEDPEVVHDCEFHVVNAVGSDIDTTLKDYYEANLSDTSWSLLYILKIDDTIYSVNSDEFLTLLDGYSSYDIKSTITSSLPYYDYTYWNYASDVLRYLVSAHPVNYQEWFPYDAYIFHTHFMDVCCWTRRFGAHRFTTTGIVHLPDFNLPSTVTGTDGVQPKISYSGVYDGIGYYLCVCEELGSHIHAIYYGTPFEELGSGGFWNAVPDVESPAVLVYVRPIVVSPTLIKLLGIIKTTNESTEDDAPAEIYKVALLIYTEGVGEWVSLGTLPFTVPVQPEDESEELAKDSLSLSLFGVDSMVNELQNFSSPESAAPQIAVPPYNLYNITL